MGAHARLRYIDGLRGVAVLLVILSHAVWRDLNGLVPIQRLSAPRMAWDILAHEGFHGVSLFLVVSGFCLSYPALKRRREGISPWFDPPRFFAGRCLRILPPYYAVLALLVILTAVLGGHVALPPSMSAAPLTVPNVAAHLVLIQNATPWFGAINGSFWSLGLEWQWYWAFPLILALFGHSRLAAVLACLAAMVAWHLGTHDLWQLWNNTESGALPERLFEFCCGIVAAEIILTGAWQSRRAQLALRALVLSPLSVLVPNPISRSLHLLTGQPQLLWGLCFGALLILSARSSALNRVLSARALTSVGAISYSVYLIHQPVVEAVEMYAPAPLQSWFLAPLVAVPSALLAGWCLHLVVERPLLRAEFRDRLSPWLLPCFAWSRLVPLWELADRDDGRRRRASQRGPAGRPVEGLNPTR